MATIETNILPFPKKYFAQRFALWIGLTAIFMAFAGLTSAYIVRRADSDWLEFSMPSFFYISTVVILLSSVSLMFANHHYRKDNFKQFRFFLIGTFVLGIVFSICQYLGWQQMSNIGANIIGENATSSASFVGVISGFHVIHVLGGLLFLLIAVVRSFYIFKNPATVLVKEYQPAKGIRMDLLSTYWHFVDVLWVYLFIFFIVNK